MRESLANAITSSHLQDKEWETPLDKIKALGYAGKDHPIGTEAIHLIDALQPKSYNQLVILLAKRANAKFTLKSSRQLTIKMCQQVIKEASFRFCHTCAGRREVNAGELVIICDACKGSGLHRYTDISRAQSLGLDLQIYLKHWERRFKIVTEIFNDDCKDSLRHINKMLQRY